VAQPQITKTRWSPQQGGLAADIDPKDLSGGNLLVNGVNTGGMNVRNVGKGQNVMMDYEPIYGNEYVYRPDPIVEQNKKWRIYADVTSVPMVTGAPLIQNGDFATNLNDWTVAPAGSWVWNAGVAQRIPALLPAIISQSITAPYGSFTVTFDFTTITAGNCTVLAIGNNTSVSIATINANGSYSYTFNSPQAGLFSLSFVASPSFDGSLDNVTLVLNNQLYGFDYTLANSTGSSLLTGSGTFDLTDSINNTLVSIENFITTDLTAYNPSATSVITGSYTGYVEFELTTAPYFDYDLQFNDAFSSSGSVSLIVVQEAIDPSCVSEWNLIGSDDKPGDDFQFWTTRLGLPIDLEIFNITNPVGTTVRVETLNPHGLTNDEAVRISNVISPTVVNGIWTITYVSATEFDLNNCVWTPTYISGGIVTTNIYGVGEIGVAVKDEQGVISYTRLLRSKEFNFSTLKQIDCRAKRKQDIQRFAVYYTDNYNVPRVFYYKGVYQADGALNYISSENIYDYGNISLESKWLINNEDFYIEVIGQDQFGGQLKSGNWRYSARLLTADFSTTNWSQLTEGIPVFLDPNNDVYLIGDNPDVVTSKVNRLKITNNIGGIYTYVEIAALNYFNNISPQGFIIGRYELNGDLEQFINHTGFENLIQDLDNGSLNEFTTAFIKAQNAELLDNRAILTNLTPAQTIDFTEWVSTFQYSLNRKSINPVSVWSTDSLQVGEYQDPMTVYSYKSHMMMETYRYGFKFKLNNGTITQVFYPGYDIKIDLTALPDPARPERLSGTFTTFDLTDQAVDPGGPSEVYTIYIGWENINLSYLIDGIPAYELVDEIIPCRATVVPEVLLHGNAVLGVSGVFGPPIGSNNVTTMPALVGTNIAPYPFMAGETDVTGILSDIYPGTPGGGTSFTTQRESLFIYAPDFYFDLYDIVFQSGDEIYSFGNPTRHDAVSHTAISINRRSYYAEYDGYTNISANPTPYVFTASPGSGTSNHPLGTSVTAQTNPIVLGGLTHRSTVAYRNEILQNEKNLTCRVSTPVTNTGPNTDYGFYRVIYYRPRPDKYGDPSTTRYTESLIPYRIGSNKSFVLSGDFISYGDCFTQKSYCKFRYPGWWSVSSGSWFGGGSGVGFYTQNRNNIQLRCPSTNDFNRAYSVTQVGYERWISFGYAESGSVGYNVDAKYLYEGPPGKGRDSQLFYNRGYTPTNGITSSSSFNPLLEYQTDWGNAIAWSDPESEGSNTDNLRNFPPLNLKFLDYTQGSITDARALNGELVTVQAREVQRQYFDTTAVLTTQNGGEAYLGTGAVLSRRGTTINKFGSRHKWSVIMGLSDKGGDVLYGIDDINNTVWRLGYDGTNGLDEIQGMKSFFANNLSWIRGKYTPANDEGIRGVANQRYREVIWTLRGRKQYPEWKAEDNFCQQFSFNSNVGNELVFNGNFKSSGSLTGWDSLDGTFPYAPNLTWNIQYLLSLNGYAANKSISDEGYLVPSSPLPLNVGSIYRVQVIVPITPTLPIDISFQLGGPVAYSITSAGNYIFSYTAVLGDNNICIYSPLLSDAYISFVSIKEIFQTGLNWNGGIDWNIENNQACTVGSVNTSLVQAISDYIIPNYPYTITFKVSDYTSGDLRVKIGNVTSAPLSIAGVGTYSIGVSPTATGIIEFQTAPNFNGCIRGNVKLCTSGVLQVYNTGDIVQTSGYGGIMATWSQTPDIWICLKDNVTSNPYTPPDPDDPDWELIPHTNPDYYTEYTIVYNELKNKFQTFMTILPKIYAHFQNGYLVPKPISDTGRMYVSDTGIPTTWFETNTGDAYLDAVINTPAGRKRYLAARVESDVAPTFMTVSTNTGSSTTSSGEFEQREGQEFDGYVKDTPAESIIQGDFGVFRFTFAAGTYNKLNSFIASVRERARKWFK
jgi:hypothetical protein